MTTKEYEVVLDSEGKGNIPLSWDNHKNEKIKVLIVPVEEADESLLADIMHLSGSSMDFWDNDIDDAVWNEED